MAAVSPSSAALRASVRAVAGSRVTPAPSRYISASSTTRLRVAVIGGETKQPCGECIVAGDTARIPIGASESHKIAVPAGARPFAIAPANAFRDLRAVRHDGARLAILHDPGVAQELQHVGHGLRLRARVSADVQGP